MHFNYHVFVAVRQIHERCPLCETEVMEHYAATFVQVTSLAVKAHKPELVWTVEGRNVKGGACVCESVAPTKQFEILKACS